MSSADHIVVIVPTYNEAGNVERLIPAIATALPTARILIVDDNSADGTADISDTIGNDSQSPAFGRVRVLRRQSKDGLGAAYRAGFSSAIDSGATICIQMDADFSHNPRCLPLLVEAIDAGSDIAVGSRYVPGGDVSNWAKWRQFLSRWGNRYASTVLRLPISDATGGFRAYKTQMLLAMNYSSVLADGYGFQVEMSHRAARAHATVAEIPITFVDREIGESKLSHNIISEAFVLVLRLWWRDRFASRVKSHS